MAHVTGCPLSRFFDFIDQHDPRTDQQQGKQILDAQHIFTLENGEEHHSCYRHHDVKRRNHADAVIF
ncbi:hypothetical protein PANA5342_0529 [Pantoea ananatis LMG 5342]|nr:hypothetical protein PANA5342_0529 [Pantoea ananatis LMG 5342]